MRNNPKAETNMIELQPEAFAFLVDMHDGEATIGLNLITTEDSYVIPLDLDTAQNVGTVLLGHVAALHSASKAIHA